MTYPMPKGQSFAPVNPSDPGEATFPHKLPIELAMGLNPVDKICTSFGVTQTDFAVISTIPQFVALYEWAMDIKTEPLGIFRLQMVMMSDDIASTIYQAMTNVEGGMPMRLKAAELAAKLGGLEPPKPKDSTEIGEKFAININFTNQPSLNNPMPAIEGVAVHVE